MHGHEWIRHDDKAGSRLAPKGDDGRFDFCVGILRSPCRKLKLEYIDGVAPPKIGTESRWPAVRTARGTGASLCRTSAFGPRYNISDTNEADGEDAVRQRSPYGQDWSRSASPRTRSAMASAPRPVGLECP